MATLREPFPRVSSALVLLGAVTLALAAFYAVGTADTFGHIAQGRQIVTLGHVPRVDTFSFFRPTPQPWANYEWLSDVVLYAVWSHAHAAGLLAFKVALCAVTGALVVARAARAGSTRAAWGCTVLLVAVVPVVRFRLVERPHLVGLAFAAALLLGLDALADATLSRRRAHALVAALAVSHIAWVNAHGSNLLGLALTAVTLFACARMRVARGRLAALLALQLVASCVSPFGPGILVDAIDHLARPAYRALVDEWRAAGPGDPWAYRLAPWLLALASLAASFVLLRARTPRSVAAVLSLVLLSAMALRSLRFFGESFVLATPWLATALARWNLPRSAPPIAFVAASAMAVVLSRDLPPHVGLSTGLDDRELPVGAGDHLARHAPGARLVAAVDDAWYAMFADPSVRVLVDGRVPFYGPEHVARVHQAFVDPPAFAALLDGYHVDAVLLRTTSSEAQPALAYLDARRETWALAHVEDHHALFLRGRTASRALSLPVGYDPAPWLAASLDESRARDDLAMLARSPGGIAYRDWAEGLLALRPFARAEGHAGLRAPRDAAGREAVTHAFDALANAAWRLGDEAPATVTAWLALAAVGACRLDRARDALERAGPSRETVFASEEIDVRAGHVDDVRDFLARVRVLPDAANDPWLGSLEEELAAPPVCAQ